MGGSAGQDGAGLLAAPAPDQGRDGQDAAGAVPGHDQRVRGRAAQRLEQGGADVIGMPGQRAHQPPVGTAVGAQAGGGLRHRAEHQRRAAAVERVGELDLRPGQLHAPCGQVEALEERRRLGQRVRGGAHVVPEPRQGQLRGPAAAPDDLRTLDDLHVQASRSQGDGSGQAVRAAAHDHRVRVPPHDASPVGPRFRRRSWWLARLVLPYRAPACRGEASGPGRSPGRRWSAARCVPPSCARCYGRDATGVWSPHRCS